MLCSKPNQIPQSISNFKVDWANFSIDLENFNVDWLFDFVPVGFDWSYLGTWSLFIFHLRVVLGSMDVRQWFHLDGCFHDVGLECGSGDRGCFCCNR